ncbi:hypothetical protein QML37_30435, partial [Klebsiella pneumoniae]|uniref:hypothetical protein n=1 Tax=Klebsiella pneumoniae TaxID=573 RepID=UPI003A804118
LFLLMTFLGCHESLFHNRSEAICILKAFIIEIKTQFQSTIKCIRNDNALEFKSSSILEFYKSHGISTQFTCTHTSQQNGVAERNHRQLLNIAHTTMFLNTSGEMQFLQVAI